MQTTKNVERIKSRTPYDDEEDKGYTPRATVSNRRRSRKLVQNSICPDCGAKLMRANGHYYCAECPGVSIGRALGV